MKKIILKSSLITVGALTAAALIVFSLWILISPQSMASACEKTGNYTFAVTCADLKYKYSKDAEDLSRCCQDSILSGKDKLIVEYLEKFTLHKDFEKVCGEKTDEFKVSDYKVYIFSNLAASQYMLGDLNKALNTAEKGGVEGYIKLTVCVIENGTVAEAQNIKTTLTSKGYVGKTADDLIKVLNEFIEKQGG